MESKTARRDLSWDSKATSKSEKGHARLNESLEDPSPPSTSTQLNWAQRFAREAKRWVGLLWLICVLIDSLNFGLQEHKEWREQQTDTTGILFSPEPITSVPGLQTVSLPNYERVVTIAHSTSEQTLMQEFGRKAGYVADRMSNNIEVRMGMRSLVTTSTQLRRLSSEGYRLVWITKEVVDESLVDARANASTLDVAPYVKSPLGGQRPTQDQQQDASPRPSAQWSPYVNAVFDVPSTRPSTVALQDQEIVHLSKCETGALLLVPGDQVATLDTRLQPFVRPYVIPFDVPAYVTFKAYLVTRIQGLVPSWLYRRPTMAVAAQPSSARTLKANVTFPPVRPNAHVSTLLRSPLLTDTARIVSDLEMLSGEASDSYWDTRHSSTWGGLQAAKWILQQQRKAVEERIPGARCDLWEYARGNLNPNVVCVIPGIAAEEHESKPEDDYVEGSLVLSAHYDSRGSFGNPRAPGADDDGSGTAMLLAVSRTLGDAIAAEAGQGGLRSGSPRPRRRRPLHLIFFSGEEQGLLGSKAYASHLRKAIARNGTTEHDAAAAAAASSWRLSDVRLAVQTDMIAYRRPGEPLSIAVPDKLSTQSASYFLLETARLYVPQLVRGTTPACCSDHQSFWEEGFPASQLFERPGPIADPCYHDSGDLVHRPGYDVEQLKSIAQVVAAVGAQLLWE
ncbi:unnamed protein product [Parajaminaea phylloscopi]